MGVRASMSISLLRDDRCGGSSPATTTTARTHRRPPPGPPPSSSARPCRCGWWTARRRRRRSARCAPAPTLAGLTAAAFDEDHPLADTLLGAPSLLDLLGADAVVVQLQGVRRSRGVPLPPGLADAVAAWAAGQDQDVVATDSLPRALPRPGIPADVACGALVLPLPEGQFVLWTRAEQVRHIDWGGDPHNKAIAEQEGDSVRLSPRKSFDAWRETVSGRSAPWTPPELAEADRPARPPPGGALRPVAQRRARRGGVAAQPAVRPARARPPAGRRALRAGGAEAQVGGDWYDVFQQPDGATVLVIGDVVGHDTAAAAAMAQLRGILRGIAYDSSDRPAGVLARLDAAVAGLDLQAMATVLVGRLEQDPDDALAGRTRLRWASAGHLPPVLAGPDGERRVLEAQRPGLLLGVDPTTVRPERRSVLEQGSTLLLYTDGLVERRDQVFDDGVQRLVAALAELRGLPVEEMCDALLTRLVPGRADDDVALVAVRLAPRGRQRRRLSMVRPPAEG